MLENLSMLERQLSVFRFEQLQTEVGFNHDPLGLMSDLSLRGRYCPMVHHLSLCHRRHPHRMIPIAGIRKQIKG